ncbi:unnamed protein product [Rotaria sordida]|uniref:Uncharacterized protein n=1 Tax=Rotaria sordida TaxID=392033 RepID=A0A814RS91_9BILA|nr:unnamed protein product [Rotaria sordida]
MSDVFSEIDLSDNATTNESIESPTNLRAHRKNFSSSHKHIPNSSSPPTNQINPSLYLNNSLHEITSPSPSSSLSFIDSNNSISSPTSTRYSPSSSISSPVPTTISSDSSSLSPKNLTRSAASIDLTKQIFNFPITRQDSIIDSLLSAIYERDGSIYGLSSSQDSDTVTTGDCTDQSMNIRRFSDSSMLHDNNTVFSKSNLANKSIQELRHLCAHMQQEISQANAILVKNLRHRDKNLSKLKRNCDIITAILQAASLKRLSVRE